MGVGCGDRHLEPLPRPSFFLRKGAHPYEPGWVLSVSWIGESEGRCVGVTVRVCVWEGVGCSALGLCSNPTPPFSCRCTANLWCLVSRHQHYCTSKRTSFRLGLGSTTIVALVWVLRCRTETKKAKS